MSFRSIHTVLYTRVSKHTIRIVVKRLLEQMSPPERCPLFWSRESWYYVLVLASRVAVRCANIKTIRAKNTIVRTAVIIYVSFYDVRHQFIATLRIHAIIGACRENISARL
jgi:hypothetical protein